MKKILKIFLLLILCASFAAPTAYASGHGGGEAKKEGEAKAGEEEGIVGGKFEGDPVYIKIKPIILPMVTNKGAEQLVTILVNVHTATYATGTVLHANMPRLRDLVIQTLYGGLSDGSLRRGGALDLEKIKEILKIRINKTFGEGSVVEILVQAVAQRRL